MQPEPEFFLDLLVAEIAPLEDVGEAADRACGDGGHGRLYPTAARIGDKVHQEGMIAAGDFPVEGVDSGPQARLDHLGHAWVAQVLPAQGKLHVAGVLIQVHEHLESLPGHAQTGVVELDQALNHLFLGGINVARR